VVQITPPELPCPIIVGSAAAGSVDGLRLILSYEARIGGEWRGRHAADTVQEQAGGELQS
jgi:hypothetical protein